MMSLIQIFGHKMVVLMVVFSRLSNEDAQEQKLGKNPLGICLFDPIVGFKGCFLASVPP